MKPGAQQSLVPHNPLHCAKPLFYHQPASPNFVFSSSVVQLSVIARYWLPLDFQDRLLRLRAHTASINNVFQRGQRLFSRRPHLSESVGNASEDKTVFLILQA